MIRIRLAKGGEKKDPYYRIIAIDKTRKRGGVALASFGYWHPKANAKSINKAEIKKWVEKGASVSHSVTQLLTK